MSDLDRTVIIPNGDGDDPQIVVLGRVLSRAWLNPDGTHGEWKRPQGYTGPVPAENCNCPISSLDLPRRIAIAWQRYEEATTDDDKEAWLETWQFLCNQLIGSVQVDDSEWGL